ncbi:hypothetical protein B0H21DRAFT_655766, partial [Amylocystis lapponica]
SFIATADHQFGPINTIKKGSKIVQKIPWTAFKFNNGDWLRVDLCVDILADANRYQQTFSSDRIPTLHRVIPALEGLLARWDRKLENAKYLIYHLAVSRGIGKLSKYYLKLDNTPVYVLALLLHLYYKMTYIGLKWGGKAEQDKEIADGFPDAKNW